MTLPSLRCRSARFEDKRLNQKVKIATLKNLSVQGSELSNVTIKISVKPVASKVCSRVHVLSSFRVMLNQKNFVNFDT